MIETDRLVLRPIRPDAANPLADFADPRVLASFGGIHFDRDSMERWVRRNLAHQDRWGDGLFTLLRNPDDLPIATAAWNTSTATPPSPSSAPTRAATTRVAALPRRPPPLCATTPSTISAVPARLA